MRKKQKPTWILFEERPALHVYGEAWSYGRSSLYVRPDRVWRRVCSMEAGCKGIVWGQYTGKITRRKLERWFGPIPRLPREAFAPA